MNRSFANINHSRSGFLGDFLSPLQATTLPSMPIFGPRISVYEQESRFMPHINIARGSASSSRIQLHSDRGGSRILLSQYLDLSLCLFKRKPQCQNHGFFRILSSLYRISIRVTLIQKSPVSHVSFASLICSVETTIYCHCHIFVKVIWFKFFLSSKQTIATCFL